MKKAIISFIALAISGIAMCAEPVTIGDLEYILTSSTMTAEVNGAVSTISGELIIPSKVEYNSVPYTVTSIGTRAFMYDDEMTSVSFPATLEKIGNSAFAGCKKLTELEFPASLKEIGETAFTGNTNLEKVTCHAVEPPFCGDYAFAICQELYVPKESIEKYAKADEWRNFNPNIFAIDESAIEAVRVGGDPVSQKVMRNGQVLIIRDGKSFNLLGAEVR